MGNAKTLEQVLVESGITIDWRALEKREIARNALREGLPADAIQRITGLSVSEIARL
jgi:hypothetical protein